MSPLLGKVNDYIIPLDTGYAAHAPGPVVHKIPFIKSYMLFKVLNRSLYVSGALGKTGDADIRLKQAVVGVLFP